MRSRETRNRQPCTFYMPLGLKYTYGFSDLLRRTINLDFSVNGRHCTHARIVQGLFGGIGVIPRSTFVPPSQISRRRKRLVVFIGLAFRNATAGTPGQE